MKKIFLGVLLYSACLFAQETENLLKVCTLLTPSHLQLAYDWFLPTLPHDCQLIWEIREQVCPSGVYMEEGYQRILQEKTDMIMRLIKEFPGEIIVYSDVDIQFFKSFKNEILQLMKGKDFLIQKGSKKSICAGFFVFRANEKVLIMFEEIQKKMNANIKTNDQIEMARILLGKNCLIRWDYLPITYFSGGSETERIWNPGDYMRVPEKIVMHHATWTLGIENKIAQLSYVKNIVAARNNI